MPPNEKAFVLFIVALSIFNTLVVLLSHLKHFEIEKTFSKLALKPGI